MIMLEDVEVPDENVL